MIIKLFKIVDYCISMIDIDNNLYVYYIDCERKMIHMPLKRDAREMDFINYKSFPGCFDREFNIGILDKSFNYSIYKIRVTGNGYKILDLWYEVITDIIRYTNNYILCADAFYYFNDTLIKRPTDYDINTFADFGHFVSYVSRGKNIIENLTTGEEILINIHSEIIKEIHYLEARREHIILTKDGNIYSANGKFNTIRVKNIMAKHGKYIIILAFDNEMYWYDLINQISIKMKQTALILYENMYIDCNDNLFNISDGNFYGKNVKSAINSTSFGLLFIDFDNFIHRKDPSNWEILTQKAYKSHKWRHS